MKLSIIVPYCNEYPQILFTVQNLLNEMEGIDGEIITIDNMSTQTSGEGIPIFELLQNKRLYIKQGKLKNIQYNYKQGHWNAKNAGLEIAEGKRILFLDSHVILKKNSLLEMMWTPIKGTLNMPICYMGDPKQLIYKIKEEEMGYRFSAAPTDKTEPYQVAVMSTCGMMIEKKILDEIGQWHPELGIYGGGENYMMYKIATCGYPIMIHPKTALYHFADKRGYSWNYSDYVRNQFIAAYCIGDEEWLKKLLEQRMLKRNSNKERLNEIADDVRKVCKEDREFIKSKQKYSMTEYFKKWEGKRFL